MNIMLCGASDIEEFLEPFKEIVYQFEGNPNCYIDGTIKYSNFKEWTDNSEESVRKSDIILFLIIKNFGEITWDIEYQMAKQIGKPFLIMCLDHTHNNYLSLDSNFKNSEEFQLKENKILTLIELLYQEKKSIAPFSKDFFKVIFKRQLSQIVTKAVEVLQKENQKTNLLKIIELKEDFKQEISTPSNRKYLMELLSDVFEKKEIRKQILECFCDNDNLKLTKIEIQNLVYDPEQGIQRRTVQLLPKLFNSDLNIEKEEIFDFLLKRIDEVTDSGFDRRLIISLLEVDFKLAIKKLKTFPMTDIGVPKRIVHWIYENREIINLELTNEEFKNDLIELKNICGNYEKGPNTLKTTISKIDEWLEII